MYKSLTLLLIALFVCLLSFIHRFLTVGEEKEVQVAPCLLILQQRERPTSSCCTQDLGPSPTSTFDSRYCQVHIQIPNLRMDNKETGCQPLEGPILCSNNCGFFGSATTMNLCSRCYREVLSKQAKESEAAAAISAVHAQASQEVKVISTTVETSPKEEAATQLPAPQPPPVICLPESTAANSSIAAQQIQKPNRCFGCNKRVGLTGFRCKCGGLFCSAHRYNDKHDCTFDYKAAARDAILKANPVIKADKINKI